MYLPSQFRIYDLKTVHDFIGENGFATVISKNSQEEISANHIPLILDLTKGTQGTLLGHFAKSNPQLLDFSLGKEILCIFSGPHEYISAGWYAGKQEVPTWNYTVVHVTGTPKIITNPKEAFQILEKTVAHFEAPMKTPWTMPAEAGYAGQIAKGITAFEIEIKSLEAKFKLNQNRTKADQQSVITHLEKRDPESSLAGYMKKVLFGLNSKISAIKMQPIGSVISERKEPLDDNWDNVSSSIKLDDQRFTEESLSGLHDFSHIEVVFYMDQVNPDSINFDARHPRERTDWPKTGIFSQRGKNRPNQIGTTVCKITKILGTEIFVDGLDAIHGTPVLDIKPWVTEFGPRGVTKQPSWISELMKNYWKQ